MKFVERQYLVADHFLPALINGDYSGMDDADEKALDAFLGGVACRGHWGVADERYGLTRCAITGLLADCHMVTAFDPIR